MYMHAGSRPTASPTRRVADAAPARSGIAVAAAGLTGAYYYNDLPVTALFAALPADLAPLREAPGRRGEGQSRQRRLRPTRTISEDSGTSNDDHPFDVIRNGQIFVNQVYEALTQSPNWENTVFVVNYDEWGGFFDHAVPLPLAPLTEEDPIIGNDDVPASARRPLIGKSLPDSAAALSATSSIDHTSILPMIEWRCGLCCSRSAIRPRSTSRTCLTSSVGRTSTCRASTCPQAPGDDGSCA